MHYKPRGKGVISIHIFEFGLSLHLQHQSVKVRHALTEAQSRSFILGLVSAGFCLP